MKKGLCALLACLLLLCAGCGGAARGEASFPPEQTVRALLESGAFSERLEELSPALLFSLDVQDGSVLYYSPGGTAEAAAVLVASDAAEAASMEKTLGAWVENQAEAERDYRPAEAEKLEHAILERRGETVLLVVAADWDAAANAVRETAG